MAKILLVDDSEELLNVLQIVLSKKGITVFTSNCVKNARLMLTENDIDLILLDVWMPEFNGRDFCKELKALSADKKPKVILFSANPELLKDYEACGADDILEKPFDIDTVTKKVDALLF